MVAPPPPADSPTGRPEAQIVTWPAESARRQALIEQSVPRLLVLEAGVAPPTAVDELEDWIWLPADEREVFARLRALSRPAAPSPSERLTITSHGIVSLDGRSVKLPPAELAILRVLADPPERLCDRERLARAAWGDVPHSRRSLDSRVFALRRRVGPLGLTIGAVRGEGFVLTVSPVEVGAG